MWNKYIMLVRWQQPLFGDFKTIWVKNMKQNTEKKSAEKKQLQGGEQNRNINT